MLLKRAEKVLSESGLHRLWRKHTLKVVCAKALRLQEVVPLSGSSLFLVWRLKEPNVFGE